MLRALVLRVENTPAMRAQSSPSSPPDEEPGSRPVTRHPGELLVSVEGVSGTRRRRIGSQPALVAALSTLALCMLNIGLLVARRRNAIPGLEDAAAVDVALTAIAIAGVVIPTILLAGRGHRIASVVPYVAATIIVPILTSTDRLPEPLGLGWWPPLGTPTASAAWVVRPRLGVAVEGAVVLASALLAARAATLRRGAPQPSVLWQISALALVLFTLFVYTHVRGIAGSEDLDRSVDVAQLVWFFWLGAIAGRRGARLGAVVLVAPFALTADLIRLFLPVPFSLEGLLTPAVPYLAATSAGLLWMPLARWLGALQVRSPRSLLKMVLLLNLADVLLTWMLIRITGAVEANPIVRVIGLPAKLALVSLAALVVARVRPKALVWPVIVMLAVTVWHLGGLALSLLAQG